MAQTIKDQRHQLALIKEFATDMCTAVPLDSRENRSKLSVEGQAKVSGLAKKLVDLGATASFENEAKDTHGVLQADLAAALKAGDSCRVSIIQTIAPKILQEVKPPVEPPKPPVEPAKPVVEPPKKVEGTKVIFAPTVYIGMPKDQIAPALGVAAQWSLAAPNSQQLVLTAPVSFAGLSGIASFHVDAGRLSVSRLILSTKTGEKGWESRHDSAKNTDETFGVSEQTYERECSSIRDKPLSQLLASYDPPVDGVKPAQKDLSGDIERSVGNRPEILAAVEEGWSARFKSTDEYSNFKLEFADSNRWYLDHRSSGTQRFRSRVCTATLLAVTRL